MGDGSSTFTSLDWAVLVGYFVGITVFGLWISRKIRSSSGYFLGDRRLPWWIMVGQSFGTGTNAENPVAQTGATFHFGFATIWYQWKNMLITPFYWLMAPWYRRGERTTIGEMVEDRFGRQLAFVYTLFAIAFFVFNQGAMLKGAGKIISVATGGQIISPDGVVLSMTVAFILYSFFGGLVASAYTDFVQGFLIIVLSFLLIPAGLLAVGGFTGMRQTLSSESVAQYARKVEADHHQTLRQEEFKLDQLRQSLKSAPGDKGPLAEQVEQQQAVVDGLKKKAPMIPGDEKGTSGFFDLYNEFSGVDAFTILMLTLNGLIGITAQPHSLTMNATGRTERAGRIGQTYGSLVKRFCTIGWALTGLIVAALVIKHGAYLRDTEEAFGYASLHLLTPGLTGLMVSCVLAANMSTCSNFMVNTGALFTRNLYREYIHPQANDRQLLWMGRLSGLALTGLGVVFALYVQQVLDAFMFTETIAALMGIMFIGGVLWKRANRYGAAAAIVSAFLVYYALNFLATPYDAPRSPQVPLMKSIGQLGDAWAEGNLSEFLATRKLALVYRWTAVPYAWATLAGFGFFILVSLITPPEDKRRIERFFDNQRRSTDLEDLPAGQPKPLAADMGQDLILLDLPGWFTRERWRGFFRRYREDLVGFILAWGMVGLLLAAAWGLMQIGK